MYNNKTAYKTWRRLVHKWLRAPEPTELTEVQEKMLRMRYLLDVPLTYEEIGMAFGTSKQAVCQRFETIHERVAIEAGVDVERIKRALKIT